ncbi:hypothetical protein FRC01_012563 [Tulasnella sp. 417]|nr:hypothetical protein FRC01_012563 [Tulasnella sp. 417]
MTLATGRNGNAVGSDFTDSAIGTHVQLDDDDQRLYRQSLKSRRVTVICAKLLANILFLFGWSYVNVNENAYPVDGTLLGKSYWIDFSVYAGVSACLSLFSFIGLFRDAIFVSHLWFEMVWLLLVAGFDGFLIWRQAKFWPSFRSYGKEYYDDPYLTLSTVSFALTLIGLIVDLLLSLYWSGFLCRTGWKNRTKYRTIWVSEVQNFPWLLPRGLPDRFRRPVQVVFGAPRETSPFKTIPADLKRWFRYSSMFRQTGPLEPISHSLIRGTVALAAWVAIIAYAVVNCVVSPLHQFTKPEGLPTKSLLQDSHGMKTYGNITGFIVLNVAPLSQFPSNNSETGWEYPTEIDGAIFDGIQAAVLDPLSNEVIQHCDKEAGGTIISQDNGTTYGGLQIEARWYCGALWDETKFRTSAAMPDKRPYVSISWDSSAYSTRQVLNAGLGSIHFGRPNITDFDNVITGRNANPHEFKPGVTFDLDAGQDLHITVGRRRDYSVRATFLDLIGIPQSPSVYVTYPILSVTKNSTVTDTQITTLNFYAGFSAYDDELYEEYLDHTVLTGLTKTGGLYSSFEVVFVLFFGRSLLAALFGKNNMNPFGKIATTIQGDRFRKRLQEAYPGIDGEDPRQRAEATCNFMHDFLLDLKPLEIKPTYMTSRPTDSIEKAGAASDVTRGEKDIEAVQGTPSIRLHYGGGVTESSEKV